MTRTEWIAARRALMAKKTPGPWHQQSYGWTVRGPDPDADTRGVRVATTHNSGDSVEREVSNASLIVAERLDIDLATNDGVISLATIEALAALVGEQEKSR